MSPMFLVSTAAAPASVADAVITVVVAEEAALLEVYS